jgi:hypothetical protein
MLDFTESYIFDFDFTAYDNSALDRACQLLFFMAGVSYYKAYLSSEIYLEVGELDQETANFLSKTYERGLGEFFYVNQLDPHTPIKFPGNHAKLSPISDRWTQSGQLVGIGGGKDSLVSVELLRQYQHGIVTWSVGHRPQLEPLVKQIGLPHLWVERTWDRALLEHNTKGAYNGHVPISAILACVGAVVSVLSGYQDIVMSNEQSANEPTLRYQGVEINHQYSKSLEFETDFQSILSHLFGENIRYYSLLRPFSEVYIAQLFSQIGFNKYKGVFSSCNQAYAHESNHMFWCGKCPKCAFIFLALTPFVDRAALESLWHGKNLLLDPNLEVTYRQLLGIEGDKPLDCVGEIKETRAAMRLAQAKYPELHKFQFKLPDNYDYKALGLHSMPNDTFQQLKQIIASLKIGE